MKQIRCTSSFKKYWSYFSDKFKMLVMVFLVLNIFFEWLLSIIDFCLIIFYLQNITQIFMEENKQKQLYSLQLGNSRVHVGNQAINGANTPSLATAQICRTPHHHDENAEQFKEYCSTIGEMLQKVQGNQLMQLKNKYRFYLNKVEKLQRMKAELQEKFGRLDEIIDESPPIQQQTNRINFIRMISSQIQKKLDLLQAKVTKQKQYKKASMKQIQILKQKITKQKDKFFDLKRLGLKMRTDLESEEKANKLELANLTFINIVNNKLMKKKLTAHGRSEECSDNDEIIEGSGKEMNLTQISSRLSSLQLMHNKILKNDINLSLNSSLRKNSTLKNSQELPIIVNPLRQRQSFADINLMKENHLNRNKSIRKSGCFPAKEESNHEELGNNVMYRSEGFQFFYRNQQSKIKSEFVNQEDKSLLHKDEVTQENRDRKMIVQFNKIQKMKEQLIKQCEKLKQEEHIIRYPSKNGSISKSLLARANPSKILKPIQKLVKQHQHKNIRKNEQKQCQACEKNQDMNKFSQQKFSLHKTDITKLKRKLQNFGERLSCKKPQNLKSDHRKIQNTQNISRLGTDINQAIKKDSLIIGQQTLCKINEQKEERQAFLSLSGEEVLKRVVEGKQMGKVLRIMEKENATIFGNKTKNIRLIR